MKNILFICSLILFSIGFISCEKDEVPVQEFPTRLIKTVTDIEGQEQYITTYTYDNNHRYITSFKTDWVYENETLSLNIFFKYNENNELIWYNGTGFSQENIDGFFNYENGRITSSSMDKKIEYSEDGNVITFYGEEEEDIYTNTVHQYLDDNLVNLVKYMEDSNVEYDSMKNPYYYMFPKAFSIILNSEDFIEEFNTSKNNPIKTEDSYDTITAEYEYNEDNLPIKAKFSLNGEPIGTKEFFYEK